MRRKSKRPDHRVPVALVQPPSASRRGPGESAAAAIDRLAAPVPGHLLVLLSRLHRSEPDQDEPVP